MKTQNLERANRINIMNRMAARGSIFLWFFVTALCAVISSPVEARPPAVPLVACDPYFSIWSPADKLTDADTVH